MGVVPKTRTNLIVQNVWTKDSRRQKKLEKCGSTSRQDLIVGPELKELPNEKETLHSNKNNIPRLDNRINTNSKPVSILKRSNRVEVNDNQELSRIIYPKLPYHERWALYCKKRNEMFNEMSICTRAYKKPKRSTVRYRNFFKIRKKCRKLLVSTIISNPKDMRYYAKVSFLDFEEYGLLDTGANVSCLGSDLALQDFSKFPNLHKIKSHVKTADGNAQDVRGWMDVNVTFKDQTKQLRLFMFRASPKG